MPKDPRQHLVIVGASRPRRAREHGSWRRSLCMALALVLCAPLAAAQQPADVARERAAETFRQGVEAFDRRDFEAARVAFLQTLALKPNEPAVQRNLGLSEIYSGHYLDGARRLARVLQTTKQGSSEERGRMQDSLKKAETYLQRLTVEVDVEGAEIVIEGVELGRSPLPFAWYLAPGPYEVSVRKAGYQSWTHSGVGIAGRADHLRIVLDPLAAEPSPAPSEPAPPPQPERDAAPRASRGGANLWLLAGGALLSAAGIASGITLNLLASDNREKTDRRARDVRNAGGSCDPVRGELHPLCDSIDRAARQHDRQQYYALVAYSSGAAVGLLTLVYGLWLAPDDRPVPRAALVLDRDQAGLLLGGSF